MGLEHLDRGAISGEWKAPPTFSGTTRLAPSSLAAAGSRSRAVHSPDTTTLPGALSLATASTWPWAVASTAISTPSADSPSTELIDPGRASAARCIASARLATSSSPASNDSAPAATRAENSPRECPAT